ncbi:GNAT family N-acetyltransferase [Lactococcus hircilactis]|uniref:GNAT family N-acetyltransferase n=1 Tax=Lactococcus hircilactis TaxID=1494462 RepID=A0A7X2CZY5_9LACT|nr:GNAT family N-acetyltransferase [Lactococcus hircilactis]MQW38721.1 GNAT family N-acetyltransferase [Lactococcus hircilactis]
MTTIKYDFAKLSDLDEIMHVENSCFTPDEASSREAMLERISLISDTFIVARDMEKQGTVVGIIVGPTSSRPYITDDLFDHSTPNKPTDTVQTITSLAVLEEYRKHKIATHLLEKLAEVDRENGRKVISLTCLDSLIPYYEKHGFKNKGKSESKLAGETWYNMTYDL